METALKELYLRKFGEAADSAAPLKGDASSRRLYRIAGRGRTVIGAVSPDPLETRAFLAFSRHFRREGLRVPEIYAEDLEKGLYLEEDLGDTTLFQFLTETRGEAGPSPEAVELYRKAARELPRFQMTAGKTLDYGVCYPRASFDRQSMAWDLNYFKYYFLRLAGAAFDEQSLEDDFGRLAGSLLEAGADFFLYRDFQSRNIMIRDGSLWFIDYQGGRKGALQYDVASLLFDAKADLPFALREELLEVYLEAASKLGRVDRKKFKRLFPGFAYIRIFQAMGAYGLRGFYERKSHFLQSIPYAIRNLEYLLRTAPPEGLPALSAVLQRLVASSALRQFGAAHLRLTVRIQSFSYKNGVPGDDSGHGGGFVFDCRALPNPGKEARFAKLWGTDAAVEEFLDGSPEARDFLEHSRALVGQAVENYKGRNFTELAVAFGCTGGRHRSVYCAERLAARLRRDHGVDVELVHRERREAEEAAAPERAMRSGTAGAEGAAE